MSSSQVPTSPPTEEDTARTIVYDPTDPFWRDTEDDDDDMDFLPAEEGSDEVEDGEGDTSFHDAAERLSNLGGVEIAFEFTDDNGEDDDEDDGHEGEVEDEDEENEEGEEEDDDLPRRPVMITRDQIMQLLGHAGLGRIFAADFTQRSSLRRRRFDDDDDDEEDDSDTGTGYDPVGFTGTSRRRRGPRGRDLLEKVPSEQGKELMQTGTFGSNPRSEDSLKRKKRLAYDIMRRELGAGSDGRQKNATRLLKQNMIPESVADTIIHYNARCYSGQFSDDGNFFFSCAQDFKVRMYDTSNPYDWKYYKTVRYHGGQWTITDASLSPDNRFLAYSSIRSIVSLAHTDPDNDSEPHLLDFNNTGTRNPRGFHSHFGIWSIRFSGDGREIVAGTGDSSVYVYDIERRQSVLRIPGHQDDVNAVCFGDTQSPHILYSGSDDTTLKVWDRRSMGDGREAGVFLGHTEGLTYVDSKGDGRYVLSNAKDQTAKLWDLRKMMSKEKADRIDPYAYTTRFEYRSNGYDYDDFRPHPHDCSLVTFRGHKVLKTLIRCHFSPPGSTDSKYVYSGSYDGKVYIWNMDATPAGTVDVLKATKNSRPRDPDLLAGTYDYWGRNEGKWNTCVRDASWHPNAPMIAATSWNGWGTSQGTCTVHTWNDGVEEDEAEPKIGRRVNAQLQHDERLYTSPEGRSRRHPIWYDDMMDDD
ncbi:WD40 repeat-like protein [Stemphylium lycopersici]|uniref:WD40 repeat-like protein n=1 Tax=Stemphylium lycopersici TaxID=183478 RepID=A0A364N149_STELY|nr:wd repeat-containing protein [Stemphylium lycopersici]RAR07488.1 WD40 repeat-like protein [Stemphylium lycopersici]RAR09216.1 WD40 repeat-like protein [Stemphylium lycopersici]